MRFFSQKNRRDKKITIFKAPESISWLFGVSKILKVASALKKRNCRHTKEWFPSTDKQRVFLSGLLLVSLFACTTSVESNFELTKKQEALHVFPGKVVNTGWNNVAEIQVQDVSEDGVYQSFNKTNSAYLDLHKDSVSESPDTEENTEISPDTESAENPLPPEAEDSDDVPINPEESVPVEESDQGQSESPVESSEVQASAVSRVLEILVSFVSGEFVLAQETTDVPVVAQDDTFLVTEPVVSDVSSDTEDTPLEENPVTQDSDVVDLPDQEDVIESSSEDTEVSVDAHAYPITLSDFSIPELGSGQFITNIQLRVSLGAQYHTQEGGEMPSLEIEYNADGTWTNAGTVDMESEVSNALNGGYYLFALPSVLNAEDLDELEIRMHYRGDTENLEGLFIDSAWIEINTETFDKTIFEERLLPTEMGTLELPKIHELISSELDFSREEDPKFILRYESQRNVAIRFLRSIFAKNLATVQSVKFIKNKVGVVDVEPTVDTTTEGLWTIQIPPDERESLQPGTYTVELVVDEGGKLFTDTFEFQWGMIALNPNQTEYELGDTATISLGALSPDGNTLCEANLNLYIIDPQSFISRIPVLQSGVCNGNNVIDRPDYVATFTPSVAGTYEMYVEHIGPDETVLAHTGDTFLVTEAHALSISRNGPTRIYPPALYPMQITVSSKNTFSGTLIERVPGNFVVHDTDARILHSGDQYELHWDVELTAGESRTFTYSFDAPDISPFLYTVGPADLVSDDENIVINELVPETPQPMLTETITTPIEETVSELPPEVAGDAEPAPTEESPQEENVTPSQELQLLPDEGTPEIEISEEVPTTPPQEPNSILEDDSLREATSTNDTLSTTTDTVLPVVTPVSEIPPSTAKTFQEHRRWQIASDATGSMILFWSTTTVPVGWTCISCVSTSTFYNRFPKGEATYGTTGGSPTSTHTVTAAVNATNNASSSENRVGTGASTNAHTHTFGTPVVGSTTTLPAYRALRVIQYNSAGDPGTIPAGAVLMFDGTLPGGWTQYTALDDRYPMGQSAIVSSSTNTHKHSITGTLDAAAGSTVANRTGGTQSSPLPAPASHLHTMSTSTVAESSEPPYIEVIFATSSSATATPLNSISMWSDTPPAGFLNRSAQSGDPFYQRYIKGSATYGTTGGSDTHTHLNMSATTSSSTATTTARNNSPIAGIMSTHVHTVDFTNFTTASSNPPFTTVIFAKYYGLVPIYDQVAYKWYTNATSTTPNDPWPSGGEDIPESTPIDSTLTPLKYGDIIRLRVQLNVSNSSSTGEAFKLQFGTTSTVCTDISSWTDVGSPTSSVAWIGYDNSGISDGATLASSTILGTDIFGSYEEQNPTVTMPNQVGIGQDGEWDFVLKQNGAEAGENYCFKMVKSDGNDLFSYTEYPMLVTNVSPSAPTLSKLFDNEKVATTTPTFDFFSSDSEANDLSYQIQIDDDYTFGSVNIDQNTITHGDQFQNINTPADKDPYTDGNTIRFTLPSALSNGVTYYWRVRAQDPTGSNAYGDWSTIYSFTIDTSLTVSAWHQTMEEQFDTDTLVGVETLATDLVQLISGSTTGTTTSAQIDFLDGTVGNAWGSLEWTDNEAAGDIKYKVEYYDASTDSWAYIPDADLSGNSSGFDTSSVSLLSVDVETYQIIRLVGVFTNSGGTPTLSDWTVKWGYRIETPTINAPFRNEKVATTTPTFEFTTTDPQSDDLAYEIQWSGSSTFAASTTRMSSTSAGFINISNGLDLTPFTSGATIQFTIQSGDALVNGRTYWWRVRAIDPNGSRQYSFYTDAQSFTVATSTTVSTWFQTTDEQFNSDTLSGTITQGTTSVTVATTSRESLMVYAEGAITTPRYRIWDGTVWGSEGNALDVGATQNWIVTKASPADNEYVLATLGTDADVNVQVYQNGGWGNLQEITAAISDTGMRGFDVAYEQTSGDAMVVSCDGNANPSYWTWNGSSWTFGSSSIGISSLNTCGWIKLIADPNSDEIIAVTRDTTGSAYEARVWSGSSWGNSARLGSMNQVYHEGIAAEYEDSGGQAVVAVSNGVASSFIWTEWNGTRWSPTSTATSTIALGDDFEAGTLKRDLGTDNMVLCYVDEDADIGVSRWDGSAFTAFKEFTAAWATAGVVYNDRPIDCSYESGGSRDGYATAIFSSPTTTYAQSWNGATWSTATRTANMTKGPRVQVRRTNDNLLQVIEYASTTDRYDFTYWNGSAWSNLQTLETDASVGASPFKEPFMIATKNPVTTGSVVGDPLGIDFYAGSGPYWQQMSWTDTESGGSTLLYQVEYYNTASSTWDLIPDALIPGNSVGTTTSPINLANVLPVSTYSLIRPVANFTCNLGTCPVLQDWTITWSAGITISGTAQGYDQATNTSSGTVAVALNGTLQTGKTGTISAGTWSIGNVNASPGDVVTVFINGANDTNEAVAVAHYDGVGDMSGLRLYERHVTLGSDDATTTPFTNIDIGRYDFTNDEDLFFDVSSTSLDMCVDVSCPDSELYIIASSTYRPGGTTDLNYIENNGTLNFQGYTIYVARSWDNNGTTTSATSSVVFTATSTAESLDENGAVSASFYNLTFGTTTGSTTWSILSPLDVNNTLTITRGTFARGTSSITIGGSLTNSASGTWTGVGTTTFDGTGSSNWTDTSSSSQNIGRVVVDGTSKTIVLGGNVRAQSLAIGADDIFDLSTTPYSITVLSDWINNNTFVSRTGTVHFVATTTNRVITVGGDAFYNLNFNGSGGSWSFTESSLSVTNDFTISTGTVTMPTGTTTISGSLSAAGGTFAHNNASILFDSSSSETITASGTTFTNAFYNVTYNGSGSWTMRDSIATTSNNFTILQGSVTLPSGTLVVGSHFTNSGGTFAHNSGTINFTSATASVIDTNASFYSMHFIRGGTWSFVDSSVTVLNNLTMASGTLALPSGTLSLGGSLTNSSTLTHNSGTVLFNATTSGKTIATGSSTLNNMTFNSATGGWTIVGNATTSNNFTLSTTSSFTLASGTTLAVFGTFTNSVGGASTTWSSSTLSLESGSYTINTKTNTGDAYGTLRIKANTDIKMWNSTSSVYSVDATGSLYSEDHSGVDGSLYIFGEYVRTSGTEYWNYSTDFDGSALSTSTSRQVTVSFASGATASFTDSTVNVSGTTTATTTVSNQGSGTYTIDISGGTTTAQYYSFANLGASGVSLLAQNKVTSLRNGAISPGVGGGTGLTVSSSTIDANPALQIYSVRFATTSLIVANNVKQIDGTPASYWWFRESTGGISGESNDFDTGNPGSIRWDDSSLVITVSGRVFSDDGVTPMSSTTCDGATQNVRIVVDGNTSAYTGSCSPADGSYSIGGVTFVGDVGLTTYLDTNGGESGVVVTKTPTGDITNHHIYAHRVITKHQDVLPLTIADMAKYDNADDSDIKFRAATGTTNTLVVDAYNELHIASSTTFAPAGSVTIGANASGTSQDGSLHLDDYATFTGVGTTTYTIGGSITLDQGAVFTPASSTVILNATTTGKAITTATGGIFSVNELQFNGVGGGWNIGATVSSTANIYVATGTVTGTGNISLSSGSFYGDGLLSLGSGTTTISQTNTLGGTQGWTFGNLVLGSGSVVGTTTPGSTATTTILGKLTLSTAHFLSAGGSVWDLRGAGTVFSESGTFIEATSTVRYSGTSGSNILSTNYYNLVVNALGGSPTFTGTGLGIVVLNDLTVGGFGTTTADFTTNDPALDVNGSVTILPTSTLIASNSGVFTVGGNWSNGGTFTGSNGTVTFDSSGASTLDPGSSPWSNVTINGSGTHTVTTPATTTNTFVLTNTANFTVSSGMTLAVGGTFTNNVSGANTTWTGSTLHLYGGGNYTINSTSTSDTYNTLTVASSTHIRMWNSAASNTYVDTTGSLYSQDNANVNGALYIYGAYTKTSGTDYWSYATDFNGVSLAGGNERAVAVSVASSSSIVYTGGGLEILGTSTGSTTLANQGAGTYAFRIGGSASTTMSYYTVSDLNASGLVFSGTPNVTTISHGSFTVAHASGTALTVGGTVIDQNPAKTFTDNSFGTTTGVIAYNVTATGTTVSSWRFTNYSGAISGESFDNDPGGDPGYVVWDDSAASISIAGHVYSDEGTATSTVCDGVTSNIHLRVAGLTSYTTNCNASGAYSISGIAFSPGDSFVVYIDGNARKAATVSQDPISSISNFDLYENRVIVRHEDTTGLSIADMATWDSSDDADIPFTAVDAGTDTLTLPADRKLIVWTNKTFRPAGNVTLSGGGTGVSYDGTLQLYTNASFVAQGSESHAIGGSFLSDSGASFTDANSTVTFTSSFATRTIDVNLSPFYNLTFSGSGSWIVSDASLSVQNDFIMTQGSTTLPNGTTTVTGSFTVSLGTWNSNNGTVLFNSSAAETIRTGGSSFKALSINGTGSYTIQGTHATATGNVLIERGSLTSATGTLTIGGDFTNNATFVHGSGVLRFTSTTSASVSASSSDLYSTTFAGGGAYTFTNTSLSLLGSLQIQSGSVTLASGTMSIGGSFLNTGGTFNHSSGTILFNSSDVGETINPGSSPFYAVNFGSASGGWTITNSATTTSAFSLTSASNFTMSSSTRLYVGGVFTNLVGGAATTWTGSTLAINSGSSYTINSKVAGGDIYNNVIVGSSTNLRAWSSAGTIIMDDSQSSFYSQNHASTSGALNIYGNYARTTGSDYWSYETDFDGTLLLIGSKRQVSVSIASGATTTINGGTLNIVGSNGFNTTISNQGSGTYTMNILGGTFNAQYYSFANMDSTGLALSGTTSVTSLSSGNFTLAVNGGSLITLSSTTLNYNAGLVTSGVSFATTTAITGTNVRLNGTTTSAWSFTGHTGNFDGEDFDYDGGDDCGSVRWDDSACLLTQESAYRFRSDDGGEGVPDTEWYDQSWTKRKRVTITNADAFGYTNAVVKVAVPYDSDMQTDFEDLRFTDSDGTTLISHFTETYTASTDAVVWVRVPVLATSTDTAIYMYYGNGGVSDASATSTFNYIDTFEDGNITEYSGDTSLFNVGTSFAYERTEGLDTSGNESAKAVDGIYRTDVTVSRGEILRYLQYIDTGAGPGDETCTLFGVQNPGSGNQNYAVCLELYNTDRVSLARDVDYNDSSGVILASTTITYVTGWYEVEIKWGTNSVIAVTVSQNGTVVATTSATDSTYTSGGVGYTFWFQNGGWDIYSSRNFVTTTPSIRIGGEQVSGGATWLAALNTAGTGIDIGDNGRVRFLIENTGLPISNQNFRLEYASKGASPSCESVGFGSYTAVPAVASCGVSPICMTNSTHISNLASSTDLLGGEGTFTSGQVVEDSSNSTGNINVGSNEYTELEYAFTPTINAVDTNYCFRVTNAGAALDSYSKVAELRLTFVPTVTSLSLNGGNDITLTGGATTTVTATGTVTDLNGYADLAYATTTIYRSGVSDSCTVDNNNCYSAGPSQCSFVNCSGNSCDVQCSVDMYYHADPTDIGTYGGETWRATLAVTDMGSSTATGTAPSIDLITLRALSVGSAIAYPSVEVNSDSGSSNATSTIQNIGNSSIDISIEGTDLSDGGSSLIPVNEQKFATSSFTYSSCVFCSQLATTTTNFEVDLNKPTTIAVSVIDDIFWGIAIPYGVAGAAHQGVNTFYAVND